MLRLAYYIFIAAPPSEMFDFYPNDQPPLYPDPRHGYPNAYPSHMNEEPFQHLEVNLERQVSGFGFRVIGGREENSQATIGGIVPGGAADLDGRLVVISCQWLPWLLCTLLGG